MDQTTNLSLPFIMPSQAQKQVTHNQALQTLDVAVQLAVLDRDLSTPPGSPTEGARYIVSGGGSGAWSGKDGMIAAWQNGAWSFLPPLTGWLAWVGDEATLLYYTGGSWSKIETAIAALQNLTQLGIGTTADGTNPFSAKLNSALWTARYAAEGGSGNLRYTMNKELAADVLSLLLQTGYSGRAEFGLIGNDNVTLKVSPDGSTWTTALTINNSDGTTQFAPGSATAPGIKIGDTDSGIYGSGSVLRFAIDGTERAVLNQYGLSIGEPVDPTSTLGVSLITSASGPLAGFASFQMHGEAAASNIVWLNVGSTVAPAYNMRKGRGTIASPALPASGDSLGIVKWQADLTGGGVANAANLSAVVTEPTPSATKMGTRLVLTLAPLGSATATEVMRVEADVGLSMFGANPVIDQNRHHVLRSYTVATLPSATGATAHMIYVSDGTSNKRLAVCDGTNWRWPDGNIVS